MQKTPLSLVLAVLVSLSLAQAAGAASPPKGNYGCSYSTLSGTFYAGTLNIVSASSYKVSKKKKGTYSTRSSCSGRRTASRKLTCMKSG